MSWLKLTSSEHSRFAAVPVFLILVMLLGVSILMRFLLPMNSDTSWLLTASEMLVDGKRLYIDIGETNPPASIWIHVPVVALARILDFSPDILMVVCVFGLLIVSVVISYLAFFRTDKRFNRFVLLSIVLATFVILPGVSFAQRDHIAAILCLPFLSVTMARASGRMLPWPLLVSAGICGGIVMIIKPHFALALEMPVLIALLNVRSWRVLFSAENLIAGTLMVAYVAVVVVFCREFWAVAMPINTLLYLPAANRLAALLSIYVLFFFGLFATSWIFCGRELRSHPSVFAFAAAAGFGIAFILQGKLWYYHVYPMIAFALVGGMLAMFDKKLLAIGGRPEDVSPTLARQRWLRILLNPGVFAAVVFSICFSWFVRHLDHQQVAEAIVRIQPRPTLAVLSGDISVGHPVARMVDARWSMTSPALWALSNALLLRDLYRSDPPNDQPDTLLAIAAAEDAELATFLSDLRRNRPDILLALSSERDLQSRVRAFPGMAAELAHYELADTAALVGRRTHLIDIFRRRPNLRSSTNP
ncbi:MULTISPECIES: hypothetical protein [unclassified Beijerinckia]|uniref:hypothetical protein n=1 Tax=unclassified Beijerinckia TaxID=2638183 RepID=UPI00089801D0|nr:MULTISPECIES: hypothetical protein [unclassified Beijerinckia]MDH7799665.1 hypothetical protein [Beijerinckia sp. GAS462]SEB48969.1 hypothetical protein SAMN05443249_0157 [Beijerinckia sp. 28-YEA-48]